MRLRLLGALALAAASLTACGQGDAPPVDADAAATARIERARLAFLAESDAQQARIATLTADNERLRSEVQRLTAAPPRASRSRARVLPTRTTNSGRCGGDLPPCSVMRCESGGNIRAENPSSSASGKWQILDSTWDGYGGYRHAGDAPEDVQDAKARQLYAGGAGRSQWVC